MYRMSTTFLMFVLGRQRFAINVDAIEEVVRAVRLVPVPRASRMIEGLIDLRGAVVPVLDIRLRFGLPSKIIELADHIVIAHAGGCVVGIRVDRAINILPLPVDEVEDIRATAVVSDCVAGVAKLPDGLLLIHELGTFLLDAEAHELNEVIKQGLPA